MAERKVYFGSLGPFFYDDAEPIDDQDGDFAGKAYHGLSCTGQIDVETAPTSANHVLRRTDLSGTLSGKDAVITLITAVRMNLGALEYRTKDLTFEMGLLTAVGVESGWLAAAAITTSAPTTLAPTTLAPTTTP